MRYLFLTYYTKPNGQIDEAMSLSNRLRPKDLQTVNVILDFKKLEVVKCSLRDATVPKDWDRISSYYYKFYPAIMERLFVENGHPVPETSES